MIVSYGDKRTREFAAGKRVKAFSGFERPARLKLDRMEAATSLGDLAAAIGGHPSGQLYKTRTGAKDSPQHHTRVW